MEELITILKNKKYQKIIFISFGISMIFVTGACYELVTSYKAELKRAEVQSSNLSQVLESQVSSTFQKADIVMQEVIRSISHLDRINHLDKVEMKKLVEERIKHLPEARTLFIVNRDGFDLFRTTESGEKLYLGDREYFMFQKNSLNDELYISKPFMSRVTYLPTLSISRKIVNSKKEFLGIVSVGIPLTYFGELYSLLDLGKNGAITLCSDENIMYARFPWNDKFIGKKLNNLDTVKGLFQQNYKVISDTRKSTIDGITRYSSSRRVLNSKFFVMVGISKDEVLSDLKKRCTLYFSAFFLLLIGSVYYLFNFLRSLQELDERRKVAIQNAKLTSLGEMASGIAHEINNPLAIISTRSLQLKRKMERGEYDQENFTESLTKINNMVERIAKIVRGLKSFSRNSEKDSFEAIQLKFLVENALELCNEKFRHQLVYLKIDPIPDVTIDCREAQLVQVLLNLLNNAYDAVEHLEERWVHLAFLINLNGKIAIVLTDSGNGIPDSVAQNIMQPFFTTKDVGRGTGLGLSISKGIIEDHGGKFYLDKSSKNTRFIVELSAKAERKAENSEPSKMSS